MGRHDSLDLYTFDNEFILNKLIDFRTLNRNGELGYRFDLVILYVLVWNILLWIF